MSQHGWYGFDLDGTLAYYDKWVSALHVGEPISAMVDKVKAFLAEGKQVRIFTARVAPATIERGGDSLPAIENAIALWCIKHIGVMLPITSVKDSGMIALYDDRCHEVLTNTGKTRREEVEELQVMVEHLKDEIDQLTLRAVRAEAERDGHRATLARLGECLTGTL